MNLYHLKYFCDAIKLNSLGESARLNHVSPGAVSQAIGKLEILLDVKLLEHKRRLLKPTQQGLKLFKKGQILLKDFDELKCSLMDNGDISGEITFATQQSIAISFLPRILKKFKNNFSKITPQFKLGTTSFVQESLENGGIDFAITLDNVDIKRSSSMVLYKGKFVFIKKKGLNIQDHSFILTERTREVRKLEKDYLKRFKTKLPISMQINSWGVIKKMVAEGHGVGFIPDYLLDKRDGKIEIVDLKLPDYFFQIHLVYLNGVSLNKRTKIFIDFLEKNMKASI